MHIWDIFKFCCGLYTNPTTPPVTVSTGNHDYWVLSISMTNKSLRELLISCSSRDWLAGGLQCTSDGFCCLINNTIIIIIINYYFIINHRVVPSIAGGQEMFIIFRGGNAFLIYFHFSEFTTYYLVNHRGATSQIFYSNGYWRRGWHKDNTCGWLSNYH